MKYIVTIYPENTLYGFNTLNEAAAHAKILSMTYGHVATVCHHTLKRGKYVSIHKYYSWGRRYD